MSAITARFQTSLSFRIGVLFATSLLLMMMPRSAPENFRRQHLKPRERLRFRRQRHT